MREKRRQQLTARLESVLRFLRFELRDSIETQKVLLEVKEIESHRSERESESVIRQIVPYVAVVNAPSYRERQRASWVAQLFEPHELKSSVTVEDAVKAVQAEADKLVEATLRELSNLAEEFVRPDLIETVVSGAIDTWQWDEETRGGRLLHALLAACPRLPPGELQLGDWASGAAPVDVARWAEPALAKRSKKAAADFIKLAGWRAPLGAWLDLSLQGSPKRLNLGKLATLYLGERKAELRLTLVENGLDFFLQAVEEQGGGKEDPRKLKYAVLNVTSAIELVLKARLSKEHWSLIFEDPAEASREKLSLGQFKSADFEDVQDRLERVCGIDFSQHRPLLRKLREYGNRLRHYELAARTLEINSIILKSWSFLLDFIHDHMPEAIRENQSTVDQIKGALLERADYVERRKLEIKAVLDDHAKEGGLLVSCPSCLQEDTLVVPGDKNPTCAFCRYERGPSEAAGDWAAEFIGLKEPKEEYMDPTVKECDECGAQTRIEIEWDVNPPPMAWFCFSCAANGPATFECMNCGGRFAWGEEAQEYTPICIDCYAEEQGGEPEPSADSEIAEERIEQQDSG